MIKVDISAKIDTRYSFTGGFIHTAALFVRNTYGIESCASESLGEDKKAEHRGYVVSSIMKSVAALESEIYDIIVHGPGYHLGSNGTDIEARNFLAPMVDVIDGQEVLHRYQTVLHLLGKEEVPRHGTLWENAVLLVRLRNSLVHYKSRWGREQEATRLQAALRKLRLARPPFVSEHANFFPHQCLGAECAGWAVKTAYQFLDTFYSRLEVGSPLSHLESKLAELLRKPV